MLINVHPVNPQKRLISRVVEIIRNFGVIAYPTDSGYAVGCALDNKIGVQRIREIRKIGRDHNFTLICNDLSEVATYARVGNYAYRILKSRTPGPYTFILKATRVVPRRLFHPRRRTVGLRIPAHPVPLAIVSELREPIMSVSLDLPGETEMLTEPENIFGNLGHSIDLVVGAGACASRPTAIIDLTGEEPIIIRERDSDKVKKKV